MRTAGFKNQEALLNNEEYMNTFKMEVFYIFNHEEEKAEEEIQKRHNMEKEARRKDEEELKKELEEEKEKTLKRWGIIK